MTAPIEWNKVLIETSDWVTYVWIARYGRDLKRDGSKCYRSSADTASEIWQIRKITESNWVTEISYPDWDTENNYAWDDRATLTYK